MTTMNDPTELVRLRLKNVEIMQSVKERPTDGMISMSSEGFLEARNVIRSLDIPAHYCVISRDVYVQLIGTKWFQQCIEPVTESAVLTTGQFGSIFGMTILTDAWYHPEEQIFDHSVKNMFAVVSDTKHHGLRIYRTRFAA